MITAELLHGFEQDTAFVPAEGVTRGQAKALAAYELCEPFTNLRCRRVWMQYRPITEDEACDLCTDDWWLGYECYVCCKPDAPGARPFWWIEWGYALRLRERQRAAHSQEAPQ